MEQRETTGARDDGTAGMTTEFEPDVIELLVAASRRAVRSEPAVVGTDTLLGELVMGDSEAGEAIAPRMRKAGSLGGLVQAHAGRGWVSEDEAPGEGRGAEADEGEVDAAWREAWWRFGQGVRGAGREDMPVLPPAMTGAMRGCLLRALAAARAEGTVSLRCRHVARALLDLPGSRAREALVLQRLDLGAAAAGLDRLDADAAGAEGAESRGVALLRQAGVLGKSGNRLTRALMSWTSGSGVNGSPELGAVNIETVRQAARGGRGVAEPVDLLLGILALDRALAVAGLVIPDGLAGANAAADVLRRHGVRQEAVVVAASASVSATAGVSHRSDDGVLTSPAADRVVAVARLSAAEHGSPTVGTVHLLAALLDETRAEADVEGDVVRLLRDLGVELTALRAALDLRGGAGQG
ncbi:MULTISPECIES: Clp protease N-terminal domain-containing protein [unclassified Streptomyces]|uniref:Clp protease N-terminal domain-containing protein n=1 Tax=unclassified Streptomyces TaxID=2593676 RepID=UPI0035DE4048